MTTTPRRSRPGATSRLTARTPEDLLAVVPVVLGFVPHESVVMLTFGTRAFHARVDLPRGPDEVPEVVSALLDPACRHRVPRVVFVLYAADPVLAATVTASLVRSFREAGVAVLEVLRADGRCWFPLLHRPPGPLDAGVPYDVSAHPFAAQSVLDGRVTHRSRGDLAASLRAVPDRVAALGAVVPPMPGGRAAVAGDEAWARGLVAGHVTDATFPGDVDAARLLVALLDTSVRDAVWTLMVRDTAPEHVALWTDLVRRAPDHLLAPAAALLAFAAWLAGHGALAWCAIDRCLAADPGYRLAEDIAQVLLHAVSPETWEAC